jgi:G3E family GTPase
MSEHAARAPVPFTVIGGFLGAGKTTILNRLLATATGERIAVLVNDFGSVNIDAALVAAHDGETIALTNGCICCALSDDLALQLPELLERTPHIDRVVVEASGIADPGAVAQHGTRPGFRLDGVVVAVDVTTIVERTRDARIGHQVRHQLERADLFVLTHADLSDAGAQAAALELLAKTAPSSPVVHADRGDVPRDVLLGPLPRRGEHPAGPVSHGFESAAFEVPELVERDAIHRALDLLGPDVVRVKGIVRLRDDPDVATVVHVVGPRRRLRREPTMPVTGCSLVAIGIKGALTPDLVGRFRAVLLDPAR